MELENRTFDEIEIGESASIVRTVRREDVTLFAAVSGDVNPAHLDDAYAQSTPFGGVIAHGMFCGALISTVLGTRLPGPGTIYVGQQLRFRRPVKIGDTLTVTLRCAEKDAEKKRVVLECECTNQDGEIVTKGSAEVVAPTQKIRCAATALPTVSLDGQPVSLA